MEVTLSRASLIGSAGDSLGMAKLIVAATQMTRKKTPQPRRTYPTGIALTYRRASRKRLSVFGLTGLGVGLGVLAACTPAAPPAAAPTTAPAAPAPAPTTAPAAAPTAAKPAAATQAPAQAAPTAAAQPAVGGALKTV